MIICILPCCLFVVAVCHYRPEEKQQYHMPVCVGDTIHIVEQDTGKSTQIPITNLIGRRYLCLSVPGNSKIKHCGILLNMPYFSDEFSNF